jgi:hypothetical protein
MKLYLEDLHKFYDEKIYQQGMPGFFELDEDDLQRLQMTYGFAIYQLTLRLRELLTNLRGKMR